MSTLVVDQVCRRCGGPVRKRYDGEGGWYYACRPCTKAGWPDATATRPVGSGEGAQDAT